MLTFWKVDLFSSRRASFLYKNRHVVAGIVKRYAPHALYRFNSDRELILFTSDRLDVAELSQELGVSASAFTRREFTEFDDIIATTDHSFSVILNPVRRHQGSHDTPVPEGELEAWLKDRFKPFAEVLSVEVGAPVAVAAKSDLKATLREFRGRLRVTDADTFGAALLNGIGRQKLAGCGLILIDA